MTRSLFSRFFLRQAFFVACLTTTVFSTHAQSLLGTLNFGLNGSDTSVSGPSGEIYFGFYDNAFQEADTLRLGRTFSFVDVGTTFQLTAANTIGWSNFTAKLTDGVDEYIFNTLANHGSGAIPESLVFGLLSGASGPDLAGYSITRLDLALSSFSIQSPGQNPNGDGVWTDFSFGGTLAVYGVSPVPEPAFYSPFAGILACGYWIVNRRRRRR